MQPNLAPPSVWAFEVGTVRQSNTIELNTADACCPIPSACDSPALPEQPAKLRCSEQALMHLKAPGCPSMQTVTTQTNTVSPKGASVCPATAVTLRCPYCLPQGLQSKALGLELDKLLSFLYRQLPASIALPLSAAGDASVLARPCTDRRPDWARVQMPLRILT